MKHRDRIKTRQTFIIQLIEARDIQKLYEAQDAAKARLAELKGGTDGKT